MALIDNFTKEELEKIVAESYSYKEVCRKIGYALTGSNNKTIKNRLEKYQISTEHFSAFQYPKTERTEENVFCLNSTASQCTLRRWYAKRQNINYECHICGQPPLWNGKELTLTLDHINGDNHDNRLENLRWVCPNCDRQLETFAGKNLKHSKEKKTLSEFNPKTQNLKEVNIEDNLNLDKVKQKKYCQDCGKEVSSASQGRCLECYRLSTRKVERPEKEELIEILLSHRGNFSQVGRELGISDNAIRKWCDYYGISRYSKDYK